MFCIVLYCVVDGLETVVSRVVCGCVVRQVVARATPQHLVYKLNSVVLTSFYDLNRYNKHNIDGLLVH